MNTLQTLAEATDDLLECDLGDWLDSQPSAAAQVSALLTLSRVRDLLSEAIADLVGADGNPTARLHLVR